MDKGWIISLGGSGGLTSSSSSLVVVSSSEVEEEAAAICSEQPGPGWRQWRATKEMGGVDGGCVISLARAERRQWRAT